MRLSVIIPTHDPDPARLAATLEGLQRQTLPDSSWELVIVDNASATPLAGALDLSWHAQARVVAEPQLGLTMARLRGIASTTGDAVVLVDDDNVLAPDFLANAAERLSHDQHNVGIAGGRVLPRFDRSPPAWAQEFLPNLAISDHGSAELCAEPWQDTDRPYPPFAPVGAGLILRRALAETYVNLLAADQRRCGLDRRGRELVSGGDNDLVMTALELGWRVAYWPQLTLEHLIPAQRLTRPYLARLNYAIARSWITVLRMHDACPWAPVPRWTVSLRQMRAWFVQRAWRSPAHYVRWRRACGHFAGLGEPFASA